VQVLQHDEQRAGGRQLAEEARHRLEQLEPAVVHRLRRGAVRQRTVEVATLPAAGSRCRRSGAPGQERGEGGMCGGRGGQGGISRHRAQQVDERQVGQSHVAEVDAVAGEHVHAAFDRARGQFVQQPRLTDARVAGEQHAGRPTLGGPIDVRQQPGQFTGPAHHRHDVPP
jgi:hypothetical protein